MPLLLRPFIFCQNHQFYDLKIRRIVMIPALESNTDVNTALFIITSLSPKAKEAVELELYRATDASDESTDQAVLDFCFVELVKDLETIGVVLSFDYNGFTEELGKLFGFLRLMTYLLPNSLYDILKVDHNLRECVEHILNGSLGENETLIQTYLSELGGLDGQTPLVPILTDVLDQFYPLISQTEVFTDYMKNLLMLASTERVMSESDAESHKIYRDTIREMIGRLSDVINLFEGDPSYGKLCTMQSWVIKDLASPSNFTQYNYLFTTPLDSLPEDLVESYHQKWYHFKVSHMWCSEYYKPRNIVPEQANVTMMFCFLYAVHSTRAGYEEDAVLVRAAYPNLSMDQSITVLYQE